ncbi:serotriflin-like [Heteronotia binoei]|uniref:serotriflin-like n=1 Tax=Heteronotia binoei TaxID=13085 RepID=UPI00292E1AC3|nr:serotriflin-like [Heteronotia binoei]
MHMPLHVQEQCECSFKCMYSPHLLQEEEEEEEEEEDENIMTELSPEAQKIIVDQHNEVRRQVQPTASNMLKMVWDDTVAKNAYQWAEQCVLASSPDDSRKLFNTSCGETIFHSNRVTMWPEIINLWMNGKEYFKYGVGATDPRKNIFAYTQLIWYNSYRIGCAVAYCPEITFPFVYVCHYCPGGNLMNQIPKPYKEGPPCGDCPNNCEDKLCTNPCKYMDIILNCKEMVQTFSCRKKMVRRGCKATCRCETEII